MSKLGPFSLEPVDAPSGLLLRGHAHDHPHLVVVLGGGFEEAISRGGATERCTPGSIRYSPAGDRHYLRFSDQPNRCVVIELGHGVTARLPEERVYLPPSAVKNAFERVRGWSFSRDPAMPLLVEEELLELCARIDGKSEPPALRPVPAWLRRIRGRLLDADPDEGDACFSELARAEGYHPVYAARAFRRSFGCSAGEQLRRHRLEHAITLLRRHRGSLSEIALASGFADQSHLTRTLRRALGVTPRGLRDASAAERTLRDLDRKVSGVQDAREQERRSFVHREDPLP